LPYANKADVSQNFRRASQIKEGESVPGDFARRPAPENSSQQLSLLRKTESHRS
jgi:hypothetical protein